MKKVLIAFAALAAIAVPGCASGDYQHYARLQETQLKSTALQNTEQTKAIVVMAQNGDASAKTAAIVALAMLSQAGTQARQVIAAPANEALEWARILAPGAVALGSKFFDYKLGVAQSDNGVKLEGIRYGAMSNIAAGTVQMGQAGLDATSAVASQGIALAGAAVAEAAASGE